MSDPIFESALEHMQKVEEQEEMGPLPAMKIAEGLVMDAGVRELLDGEVTRLEEDYGRAAVEELLVNPDFESTLRDEFSNRVLEALEGLRDRYGVEVKVEPPVESKEEAEEPKVKEEVEEGKVPDDKDSEEVKIKKLTEGKYIPKVGDTVQIMDLEGNTTPVPEATVYDVSEDTEGKIAVEITGSDNEDERMWYGENEYQIILLTSTKESKLKEQDELEEPEAKPVEDEKDKD